MIKGVIITPLKQITDERGKVMHMIKNSDTFYTSFGEIYFSTVNHNAIKGWHIHEEMILNYAVLYGNIKFVLFDDRENSTTKGMIQEIFLGPENYCLVTVPPLVWNGFKGININPSIVANCSSIKHTPSEIRRLDPFDSYIPYNWDLKNR